MGLRGIVAGAEQVIDTTPMQSNNERLNRRDRADHPRGETFGALLKRYRTACGLSQETLAERAKLSTSAISALERGARRAPYRETVALLSEALQLGTVEGERFVSAAEHARGRSELPRGDPAGAQSLPRYLTSFVGHDRELEAAERLVAQHRLVTITGAGGVGKTRMATELAQRVGSSLHVEAAFADLTTIADGAFIVSVLASSLRAPLAEQGGSPESLAASLSGRSVLVILDNCEHVIEHAAKAASALLHASPGVRILATSRERLGISGEVVLRLPSLTLPSDTHLSATRALTFAAIRLFVERATLTDPRFVLTDERVGLAVDICRRLEGIPLAIELAATLVPTLGLRGLSDHLSNHVGVPARTRDRPTRQQTMHATIAWSCDLLSVAERTVLARLSVFAGSFTLEAAIAVASGAYDADSIQSDDVADIVAALVDRSLVDATFVMDTARYRLLESVRAFQRERLAAAGERDTCARNEARWLVAFSDELNANAASMRKQTWTAAAMPEFDNVRSVLVWALASSEVEDAVLAGRLLGNLRSMWVQTGRRIELQRWAEAAITRIDEIAHPSIVGRLYQALLYSSVGEATFHSAERALALFERSGERSSKATVYGQLGYEYCRRGRFREATDALQNAVSLMHDDRREHSLLYAGIVRIRAWVRQGEGRLADARADLAAAATIAEAFGDDISLLQISAGLAEVEFAAGNIEEASAMEEAILSAALGRPDGNRNAVEALCNLACFRLVLDELPAAEAAARNALRRAEGRYPTLTPWAIQHFAAIAARRGDLARAIRLLGYIDAWCRENAFARLPVERASYDILVASLHGKTPPETFAALHRNGETFRFEQAVEEVLTAGVEHTL